MGQFFQSVHRTLREVRHGQDLLDEGGGGGQMSRGGGAQCSLDEARGQRLVVRAHQQVRRQPFQFRRLYVPQESQHRMGRLRRRHSYESHINSLRHENRCPQFHSLRIRCQNDHRYRQLILSRLH